VAAASVALRERSVALGERHRHLRQSLARVRSQLAQLAVMGIVEISATSTRHVNDFRATQLTRAAGFKDSFCAFRSSLVVTLHSACVSTFADAGFSHEAYPAELEAYGCDQESTGDTVGGGGGGDSTLSGVSQLPRQPQHPPPRRLTFIEQANKRQVCMRISSFLRLVDLILRQTIHRLMVNSLLSVSIAMESRYRQDVDVANEDASAGGSSGSPSSSAQASRSRSAQKSGGKSGDDDQQVVPLFSLTVGVSTKGITYTPDSSAFIASFNEILSALEEAAAFAASPFSRDDVFLPFTRPVLHGKLEDYRPPPPPSGPAVVHSEHGRAMAAELSKLSQAIEEAFALCQRAIEPLAETAKEFSQPREESRDTEVTKSNHAEEVETDVEVLKSTLSRLQEQQATFRNLQDSRALAFFKVDLRLLKRTVLPNVSKAIVALQESLPRVGREKMERFAEETRLLREVIDFEPKTANVRMDLGNFHYKTVIA